MRTGYWMVMVVQVVNCESERVLDKGQAGEGKTLSSVEDAILTKF
jgi:hypothetical protein